MATKPTVLKKLEAKSIELKTDVDTQKGLASSYREAAKAADTRAGLSEAQSTAVTEALTILEKAGVII